MRRGEGVKIEGVGKIHMGDKEARRGEVEMRKVGKQKFQVLSRGLSEWARKKMGFHVFLYLGAIILHKTEFCSLEWRKH